MRLIGNILWNSLLIYEYIWINFIKAYGLLVHIVSMFDTVLRNVQNIHFFVLSFRFLQNMSKAGHWNCSIQCARVSLSGYICTPPAPKEICRWTQTQEKGWGPWQPRPQECLPFLPKEQSWGPWGRLCVPREETVVLACLFSPCEPPAPIKIAHFY